MFVGVHTRSHVFLKLYQHCIVSPRARATSSSLAAVRLCNFRAGPCIISVVCCSCPRRLILSLVHRQRSVISLVGKTFSFMTPLLGVAKWYYLKSSRTGKSRFWLHLLSIPKRVHKSISDRSKIAHGGAIGNLCWKTQTCHLKIRCTARMNEAGKKALKGRVVVLQDGCFHVTGPKLRWLDSHPFTGFSLTFPKFNYLGLVSTISKELLMLNWIFTDWKTHEAKYGVGKMAKAQLKGRFDYMIGTISMTLTPSKGEVERRQNGAERIKLNNSKSFVAIEGEDRVCKLHFDADNDWLKQVQDGQCGKRTQNERKIQVKRETLFSTEQITTRDTVEPKEPRHSWCRPTTTSI
jgi:hypothetical protein